MEPRRGVRKSLKFNEEENQNNDSSSKADAKAVEKQQGNNLKFVSVDKHNSKDYIKLIIDDNNVGINTSVKKLKDSERKGKLQLDPFTPGINLSNNKLGTENGKLIGL